MGFLEAGGLISLSINECDMRPIWSGSISFGLVNIPVKLLSAVQTEEIKFDLLSKEDLSPVRYARISKSTEKEVPWKDIVKGYEYESGRYVVIEDKDFEKANPKKAKTIDIIQFSKSEEIDPLLYEKPYYIVPAKGGEKSYKLLQQALAKSGQVGIAEFMLRNREHICALKSYENRLVLSQLRYQEELRELPEEVDKGIRITDKELQLALQLVNQLAAPFEAEAFKDQYIVEIKKIIKAKASGKGIRVAAAPKEQPSNVKDLMDVLKESLESKRKRA
jgi:DNA end-binding protein Ku